jgi:ribose 5-phosphate isomerase B
MDNAVRPRQPERLAVRTRFPLERQNAGREVNMQIGIAADHGGYELKVTLIAALKRLGCEVKDFGAHHLDNQDDYPDMVVPLARAVAAGEVARGVALCGSGVGACVTANKVPGVRAALVADCYSARQGVEDDDMNVLCLGARVTGPALAEDLLGIFLQARFKGTDRYRRRLAKIERLESGAPATGD